MTKVGIMEYRITPFGAQFLGVYKVINVKESIKGKWHYIEYYNEKLNSMYAELGDFIYNLQVLEHDDDGKGTTSSGEQETK